MATTELSVLTRPMSASWPTAKAVPGQNDLQLPILDAGGAPLLDQQDAEALQAAGAADELTDRPPTVLPYTRQDRYDREPRPCDTTVAVLENDYLRAEFLLELGGRLWSLFDKDTGIELLHQPEALQPGNLALRNAWFAGGVEWNLGFTGHWALTCEPVHAARLTAPDGSPVLRLWEYERMLGLTWRIDVWLPTDSRTLLVRPVLHNRTNEAVPVYWWSNIAAPLTEQSRVLAPAEHAWHFGYSGRLQYVEVGDEVSRPADAPHSADYFYDVRDPELPWICALDRTGHGLVQASTPGLRGRKLFVWGKGTGGRHWQQWLGGDTSYLEIQAGLARTQLEHLPLPAQTWWAWTEAYGAIDLPTAAAAPWDEAIVEAGAAVRAITITDISHGEQVLAGLADTAPEEILHLASGWGALEVAAGHCPADPANPYPEETLGADQQPWLDLIRNGDLDDLTAVPVLGRQWTEMLRAAQSAAPTAAAGYHLGLAALAGGDVETARQQWQLALAQQRHPLALRALAWTARAAGELDEACELYVEATELAPDSVAIAIEALATLCDNEQFDRAELALTALPALARELGRVRYLRCRIALGRGDLDSVRALLVDQVLVVPDLREGEDSLDALWADYCRATGESLELPAAYDFRQHPDEMGKN